MSNVRLTEYENGSIGIYNGTTYKIVLEKHEVEALKLHFGIALPTEPGSYRDADLEPWTLTEGGEWVYELYPGTCTNPIPYMPLTKED